MIKVYGEKKYIDLMMNDLIPLYNGLLCYPNEEVVTIVKYHTRNAFMAKQIIDALEVNITRYVFNGKIVYAVIVTDKGNF
ncbi:hypothetical protein [Bacillus safensis]|uniref:hypothetical protein n=1 Tax=Bacillus safensis TaxID=561879 RepID=UPI002E1C75A6|nr:hypothetical protein [Bacillus safensis]